MKIVNEPVIFYARAGCASSRKARTWLIENEVPYVEVPLLKESMTIQHMKDVLVYTSGGLKEIIRDKGKTNPKSKPMSEKKKEELEKTKFILDEIEKAERMTDGLKILQENPELLKSPILIHRRGVLIGYKEEEITKFLTREQKKRILNELYDAV